MAEAQLRYDQSDTPPEVRRIYCEMLRKMPPYGKWELIFDMYEMGKQLAMAGLRMRYPGLTEKELWWLWAHQHLGQELFDRVYGSSHDE